MPFADTTWSDPDFKPIWQSSAEGLADAVSLLYHQPNQTCFDMCASISADLKFQEGFQVCLVSRQHVQRMDRFAERRALVRSKEHKVLDWNID